MPHVSKQKVSEGAGRQLEDLMIGFLAVSGTASRKRIFKELLTSTEQVMLAKRLGIVFFLGQGLSIYRVSALLKVSPSTAARFELKIAGGSLRATSAWLKTKSGKSWITDLLTDLLSIPFESRGKARWKFLKEL